MSSEISHLPGTLAEEADLQPKPRPWFRSKRYVYLREDEATFSRVLMARFPSARFFNGIVPGAGRQELPRLPVYSNMADCPDRFLTFMALLPPDWKPRFSRREDLEAWSVANLPWPYFYFNRYPEPLLPPGKVSETKPHCRFLKAAEITAGCEPGNKAHLALAAKIFRVVGDKSVVTNRVAPVLFPSLELSTTTPGLWRTIGFGHSAVAWARERPDRLLNYEAYGGGYQFGYRPLD
jgi:hypothetical protein